MAEKIKESGLALIPSNCSSMTKDWPSLKWPCVAGKSVRQKGEHQRKGQPQGDGAEQQVLKAAANHHSSYTSCRNLDSVEDFHSVLFAYPAVELMGVRSPEFREQKRCGWPVSRIFDG